MGNNVLNRLGLTEPRPGHMPGNDQESDLEEIGAIIAAPFYLHHLHRINSAKQRRGIGAWGAASILMLGALLGLAALTSVHETHVHEPAGPPPSSVSVARSQLRMVGPPIAPLPAAVATSNEPTRIDAPQTVPESQLDSAGDVTEPQNQPAKSTVRDEASREGQGANSRDIVGRPIAAEPHPHRHIRQSHYHHHRWRGRQHGTGFARVDPSTLPFVRQ